MEQDKPKRKSKLDNFKQRNPDWKKGGKSPNPNGRPNGQRNYATLYREALIKLGQLNGKEPDELEVEMLSNAIKKARAGDYKFYKDVLDRIHGTALNKTDITTGGKSISELLNNEEK